MLILIKQKSVIFQYQNKEENKVSVGDNYFRS